MSNDLRFDFMHFMPYTYLPEDLSKYKSLWVNFPEQAFTILQKARGLYETYFSQLELADRLGFDAIVINEHHNTAYSMMQAPNIIAGALLHRVKRAKICVWGTPPNLEYPNRLAEEYAMLDVLSGGRLEVAFPLGTGHGILGASGQSGDVAPALSRNRSTSS